MRNSIWDNTTKNTSKKELLTLNDYNSINTLYGYFQVVYKYIHKINIYNSDSVKNINSKIRFVYKYFFPNDTDTQLQSMIESLKTIEKKLYDEISSEIIQKILIWKNKDIDCYRQIKSIADEINKTKLKFRQIINRQSSVEDAFKIYIKNNWEVTKDILMSVSENEFKNNSQKRQQERQLENVKKNTPFEVKTKNDKTNQWLNSTQINEEALNIFQEDKTLRKIKNRIKVLEYNISNELWKLSTDFLKQLNLLVSYSVKWWEEIVVNWEKIIDPRYSSFNHAITNKQAAIVFIQQFLHENKHEWSDYNWMRYFSYSSQESKNQNITNEDITENIAELFIKKIELIKHQDKNT